MDWHAAFTGNYLAAVEFGNRTFTATISGWQMAKLESEDGTQKDRLVVSFDGHDRGWVICKTNAMCLGAMFGDDMDGWVGKSVTLYSTMVSVGKEKKPGIRVKGSCDIQAPIPVTIRLPRKKPFVVTMQPMPKEEAAA